MITPVIVNWNAGAQIKHCIDSLSSTIVQQIIVVDNASTDGSEKTIIKLPGVTLIQATENLGFGKACNLGAQQAHSEYLLFLNPDAAVYPGTLEKALAFMQDPANAQVGICGVQMVDESGHVARSCARFPSPMMFAAYSSGLSYLFPRLGYRMTEWPHDSTREVDHVIGAFYLVRRTLFEALGGFDERFFVYYEDLDFSYRAHQAGWRSLYLADVQVFHAGGGTSNQVKARRLFYSWRSRFLYGVKHFGFVGVVVVVVVVVVELVSRNVLALARHSWPVFKETWQAYAMFWRWLPQWVSKGVTR